MILGQTKLLTFPKAAKEIGQDVGALREWANRMRDPLPTIITSKPGAQRVHRKVVMPLVDEWLARNIEGGAE